MTTPEPPTDVNVPRVLLFGHRGAGKSALIGALLKAGETQGETLRGLLLYGYAFATMGTVALYGAIVAFVAAVALLVLALLGFRHARKSREAPPVA